MRIDGPTSICPERRFGMTSRYGYNSLEDFLATNPLTIDDRSDDGGGILFPVKGREIEAAVEWH